VEPATELAAPLRVLWVLGLRHCIHLHPQEVAVQSQRLEGGAGLHLAVGVEQSRGHLEELAAAQLELQRSIDSIERIYQN
jgi:hypothetical protein